MAGTRWSRQPIRGLSCRELPGQPAWKRSSLPTRAAYCRLSSSFPNKLGHLGSSNTRAEELDQTAIFGQFKLTIEALREIREPHTRLDSQPRHGRPVGRPAGLAAAICR